MNAADQTPPPGKTQVIAFLLINGFALMSYAAAIEPLRAANLLSGRELYRWRHVSVDGETAEASNGTRVSMIPENLLRNHSCSSQCGFTSRAAG